MGEYENDTRVLGRVEGRQDGLDKRLDSLENKLDSMDNKLDNVTVELAKLSTMVTPTHGRLHMPPVTYFGGGVIVAALTAYARTKFPWLASFLSL